MSEITIVDTGNVELACELPGPPAAIQYGKDGVIAAIWFYPPGHRVDLKAESARTPPVPSKGFASTAQETNAANERPACPADS
jgi:hypothetical protein